MVSLWIFVTEKRRLPILLEVLIFCFSSDILSNEFDVTDES